MDIFYLFEFFNTFFVLSFFCTLKKDLLYYVYFYVILKDISYHVYSLNILQYIFHLTR